MTTKNKTSECEIAWEEFYSSEKAQNYCFGNYNNATRDEYVGEFSFKAGWDASVKKAVDKEKFLEWMENDGHLKDGDFPGLTIKKKILSGEFNL